MKSLDILFENDEILAIDKPAGLLVHGDGRSEEQTLVDWLLATYPHIESVGEHWANAAGETILRPGIVHRLDRETSGVILIAKTQASFEHLKEQFKDRTVEKTYNAFVYGMLKEKEGTIDRPIGKSTKDFRLWSAQRGARGEMRDAVTEYKVIEESKDVSYIEVRPKTGRTHQIRVHMKAVHHPSVGDTLYAPKQPAILGFERLALHARSIVFMGVDGKRQVVEAPLPADFESALKEF